MKENIIEQLNGAIIKAFSEYGIVIACLVIGIIMGWTFKTLFADRRYEKQIKLRLDEKDQRIAELNFIVYEKLDKVKVEKADSSFIKRVKNILRNL